MYKKLLAAAKEKGTWLLSLLEIREIVVQLLGWNMAGLSGYFAWLQGSAWTAIPFIALCALVLALMAARIWNGIVLLAQQYTWVDFNEASKKLHDMQAEFHQTSVFFDSVEDDSNSPGRAAHSLLYSVEEGIRAIIGSSRYRAEIDHKNLLMLQTDNWGKDFRKDGRLKYRDVQIKRKELNRILHDRRAFETAVKNEDWKSVQG